MPPAPDDPPTAPTTPAHGPRARTWHHPAFREGARDMAEVSLGIAAWGLITGMAMVQSGLAWPLAATMSLAVYAGSAQLAALPLIASGAPLWVVWATAVCVNLRFVVFSAGWRPYMKHRPLRERAALAYTAADFNFALFLKRFPEPRPDAAQWPYYWGGFAMVGGAWHVSSLVGIALADRIPPSWGLGFAGTATLLALACSLINDRATAVSAGVAGCAAVAAYALPLKLNLVVAIAAAIAVGLLLDRRRR